MKKNLFNKTLWRPPISITILLVFILLAVGSYDLIIWGLGSRRSYIDYEGNFTTVYTDYHGNEERYSGDRDAYSRWHGKIQIDHRTYTGSTPYRRDSVTYVNGWPHGRKKIMYGLGGSFAPEDVTVKYECYNMGIKIDCTDDIKSAKMIFSESNAFQILNNKYPSFLSSLVEFSNKEDSVELYVDSLESIILNTLVDVDEFDDFYDEAREQLESGIFDTIWNTHDFLILQRGIDEIKQSEFRMAVIDHQRNLDDNTFSLIQNYHQNYLEAVNDEGVGNDDFKTFCEILDSLMLSFGNLDMEDPLFVDSVEYRMFVALNQIYSEEYQSVSSVIQKSATRITPTLFKSLKEKYQNSGEINSIAVDPNDVAAVVGFLMQKHYNRADKIRMAVREAYLKKGGIIDLPIAVTTWGDTISSTSLNINGHVLEDGDDEITGRGVAWATFYNPTVDDNYIESESGMGEFTVNMEEMESGETYYFRSYAINSAGIAYGNCISFKSGVTNSNITALSDFDFKIYPNPVSELATISFRLKSAGKVNISIIDLPGRTMYSYDLDGLSAGNHQHKINLSAFESGVYNCRILIEGESSSKKIIVAR